MQWRLTDHPEAVLLEMLSTPVNKQNREFCQDMHTALDALDAGHPGKPLILTGTGKIFSVGLDLDHVFPLFASGDVEQVTEWFTIYRQALMRLFTAPRMTIALLNGHAFAGGLILAMCCDHRVATAGDYKFAVNEVPIGVPMPSVYAELLRHRLGSSAASEAILLGKTYDIEGARRLGLLSEIAADGEPLSEALRLAATIEPDSWPAYAASKKALLYPVIETIERLAKVLDQETYRVLVSPASVRMHAKTLAKVRRKA